MKDKFEEVKIKMVMKLRGVGRDEAIALIKDHASAVAGKTNADKKNPDFAASHDDLLDLDGEPEMVSAEEFFRS